MSKTSVITENGSLGLGLYFLFCCVALRGKFVPCVIIGTVSHPMPFSLPYCDPPPPLLEFSCNFSLPVGFGDLMFFNIWHTAFFSGSKLTAIELVKIDLIELVRTTPHEAIRGYACALPHS